MKQCTARKRNCLYSHLLGKQVRSVSEKRTTDPWRKAVPISRGRLLKIKTKTIFYCSYIQCNSLLYLPMFNFLVRPYNKLTYKRISKLSLIPTCARLTCKQPVPAFHSHLDKSVSNKQAISSTEYIGVRAVALCRLSAAGFHQPLLEMYPASVPMCNVAALTFMQLFMKICVVVVFLKKGMYVPGTAIDVCVVLTLA